MSEDEKKDVTEDTPQDEAAEAAGPVAAEEDSSEDEAPAAESPPASEAEAEPESEAGEAEPAAESEPVAEEAAEPSEEEQLPWKERRRLERSRRPHEAGPQQSPEERKAGRVEERKRKAGMRRKERAAKKAKETGGTGTPRAERHSVAAKTRQGVVVSNKGEKSITVRIDIARRHPTYEKVVRRSRTLHAHDERNEAGEGDIVRIIETRPLSKTKRWRLVEILERAK
jgi:small subunit ribosomal protein S17